MSKRYHDLLPIPNSDSNPSHWCPSGSSSILGFSNDEPLKRQRIGTQIACNACRKRKIRCNGQRPYCEACTRRGEESPCTYAQCRDQYRKSERIEQILELFDFLKSGPEPQSLDILRILRCHNDLDTALSIAQSSGASSRIIRGRESTPISIHYPRLDDELMAGSLVVYPPLHRPKNSILEEIVSTGCNATTDDEDDSSQSSPSPHTPSERHHATQPMPTLRLCDERLGGIDMSFWTAVPIGNKLGAHIISLYLETDHPLLGTFDPELFVDDLTNYRFRYCSRLLVSAIMYWGCQMYSTFDPSGKTYVTQFGEEAGKRWSEEKDNDSVLNLASLQLLSLAHLGDGTDHNIMDCVSEANAMGIRMGLFGVETKVAINKAREIAPELRKATAYAAWGTFNWIVLMLLFYQQPGLSYPEYPPVLPIPGYSWHYGPNDSSESVQESPQATYMGNTFPVLCGFWRIIHEVTLRYYREKPQRDSLGDHIGLAFAEYKYRELLAWAETVPVSMMRSEQSPHHVLVFHIWLHAAVLDIWRPFTTRARSASKPLRLKTFICKGSSPDAAYKASLDQLKHLIVVYSKKYASSTYSMLWHTGLLHAINGILGGTIDSTWRFYLTFCIKSYGHLQQSYRFAESIGRSLLSMALQQRNISANEGRHMMQRFEDYGLGNPSKEDISATFMADLNLAMTDPEEATVESLAARFDDIALFEEFTTQEDLSEDELMDNETVILKRL